MTFSGHLTPTIERETALKVKKFGNIIIKTVVAPVFVKMLEDIHE